MNIPEYFVKGAIGLASTTIVGLGAVTLGAARTNAVQDQEISTIQDHEHSLDTTLKLLNTDVQQLNVNVAILNQRLADGRR